MKKIFLISVLSVLVASGVSAQKLRANSVYLGGGVALPAPGSDIADHYGMDVHGMSGLGFSVTPTFQLLVKGEYHRLVLRKRITDPLTGYGTEFSPTDIIMIGVAGTLIQSAPLMPVRAYCLAGLGFASASTSGIADKLFKPYFELGTGIEVKISVASSFFVQVRYVTIKTENEPINMIPLTIGFKF